MSKLNKWIDNKVVQNLFVWCCFYFILVGVITSDNKWLTGFYVVLILAPAIYINNFFILPFFNKKTVKFLVFFLSNIFFFTVIPCLFLVNSVNENLKTERFLSFFGALFGALLLAITFGITIRIARDSFIKNQKGKEAELQLLKAQLNPHFLFNTLNNLYGLSVVKSDKLPGLMLQLSSLLRYSLYETKEVLVSLEKELKYIEDYISLEKIRLEEQTEINFSVKGNALGKQIAPMLLIVFVENTFKHLGVNEGLKSSVTMKIALEENKLQFTCENSYDSSKFQEENLEKGKSGIGLLNAKKRLALIYPDAHHLAIKKENGFFRVVLTLAM